MRVEAGRASPIRVTFTDVDGNPAAADGAVTVTVTRPDDTQVATGTATTDPARTGVYRFDLGAQAQLDELTARFAGTVDGLDVTIDVDVDVVARRLVDLHALRAAVERAQPALEAAAPSDALALRRAADEAEDWIDEALGYPAVRRPLRVAWQARRWPTLAPPGVTWPGDLYELTRDGDTVDVAGVTVDTVTGGWWAADRTVWASGRYVLWGTHGLARTPADMHRAGVILARHLAATSKVPDRAASMTTESTLIVFSKPAPDRPTGLPEVDAIIRAHGIGRPLG